jgi:hypothetical protein
MASLPGCTESKKIPAKGKEIFQSAQGLVIVQQKKQEYPAFLFFIL